MGNKKLIAMILTMLVALLATTYSAEMQVLKDVLCPVPVGAVAPAPVN